MSKCILIMDMPSSCDVCDFVQIDGMVGNMTCMNPISEVYGCDVSDYIGCRADGCPLRELPNPKEKGKAESILEIFSNAGYNACIDELLNGEEGYGL